MASDHPRLARPFAIVLCLPVAGDRRANPLSGDPRILGSDGLAATLFAHRLPAIIGASKPEQFKANVAALDLKLDPALKIKLDELTHEFRMGDAPR